MSLSGWFRDYVYIPLGGNRKGKGRTILNLFFVWLLTGFWHGAAWNFVLWGLYFFVILMLEKYVLRSVLDKLPIWVRRIYALFLINLSWVIFSYDDIHELGSVLKRMFGLGYIPIWNSSTTFYLLSYLLLFIIMAIASTPAPIFLWKKAEEKLMTKSYGGAVLLGAEIIGILIVMLLSTASLASDAFNPFLYFRF